MTSYAVTLYKLFLGEQDSVTGHYQMGYTIHAISCAVFPQGTAITVGALGYYTRYAHTGFTAYDVNEGDVIYDSFERYYKIVSHKPWTTGDQFQFYELELEELATFPHLAGFFGFEDLEHGTEYTIDVGMFEDGFERGYWAL